MGQGFSSGNNLYVYTDKPAYYGGDTVSGYVLLNVVEPFECNQVVLKVEGSEETSWEETRFVDGSRSSSDSGTGHHGTVHQRQETIYHKGDKKFFKQKMLLQSFPTMIQEGQYQYPFSFVLPMGLPGTFKYHSSHENAKAEVEYKIKAECDRTGMHFDVKNSQELRVFQRPNKPPSEVCAEHFQEVKTCCCIGQGDAHMIAHIQKNSYVPGEIANVVLQAENNSDVDFKEVQLFLHRRVTLKAENSIHEHVEDDEISRVHLEGIKSHTSFMGKDARVLALTLPTDIQAMVRGQLVTNDYRMVVVLKGSGTASDVKMKVPLAIFDSPPPYEAYTQFPPFWQPTYIAEPVVIAMPGAPPMPPAQQYMGQPAYGGPTV